MAIQINNTLLSHVKINNGYYRINRIKYKNNSVSFFDIKDPLFKIFIYLIWKNKKAPTIFTFLKIVF